MGGEMHDSSDTLESGSQCGIVGNVAFDQLKSLRQPAMAIDKAVEDNRLIASPAQRERSMAADIPCPTYHQNRQWIKPSFPIKLPVYLSGLKDDLQGAWFQFSEKSALRLAKQKKN